MPRPACRSRRRSAVSRRRSDGPSRPAASRGRLALVAGIGLVALVLAGQVTGSSTPPADVPVAAGELVTPAYVRGEPVWILRARGEVLVFGAENPRPLLGLTELVGWCASAESFISYWDGSRFDRRGRYLSGPAPHDLDRFDTLRSEGDGRVLVGERFSPPRRSQVDDEPVGRACLTLGNDDGPLARYHVSRGRGYDILRGFLLFRDGRPAVYCEGLAQVTPPACPPDALEVPQGSRDVDGAWSVLQGRFMARPDGGTLRDVVVLPLGTLQSGSKG